jgi:nucleobase:cation symporter-1, NCS1 family
VHDQSLYNADLAPTTPEQRTWSRWHIAALWVGMAVCIPTYGLAAALVGMGASLELAVFSVALGNLIVLVPLILNGHPGARYGIPFPVLIRSSFGPLGAHIPSVIRGLVACGWFGIQTWIGGKALHFLATTIFPSVTLPALVPDFFGITTGQFLAFLGFWLLNVAIILRGIEALKVFESWAAPFLLLTGLLLFVWAWVRVGDLGAMLSAGDAVAAAAGEARLGAAAALAIGITGAVAFWGTLALNIPDFTRYARSQRDQAFGQAVSLPTTMTFYVFIGAAVTNATVLIFGERIADPVEVLARAGGPTLVVFAMLGLVVATLSTNLAANVVSPANGFSNLAPGRIDFRRGALIAAVIGVVILPWKMWEDPDAYVVTWLVGCGGLLGAVGGVMIADYFVLRRTRLNVDDLYRRGGEYEYRGGFNPVALLALATAIAPLLPGFLASLGVLDPPGFLRTLYSWSWFVAFALAGTVYLVGMLMTGASRAPTGERQSWPAA